MPRHYRLDNYAQSIGGVYRAALGTDYPRRTEPPPPKYTVKASVAHCNSRFFTWVCEKPPGHKSKYHDAGSMWEEIDGERIESARKWTDDDAQWAAQQTQWTEAGNDS